MNDNIDMQIIQPKGVCPPQGLYNHAISVNSGKLLFIAGQIAVDENNQLVGPGDFNIQMEQTFENLGRILESANSSFGNVVKFTTYLVRSQDIKDFYEKRNEIFSKIYPDGGYPPNTLVVIDQLAREEWLIEIEAIAALP